MTARLEPRAGSLQHISLDVAGRVAHVRLAHPPLNVIDLPMIEELDAALAGLEQREDVAVILLSGEGEAFSAGVDVAAHRPETVAEMLRSFHGVIRRIFNTSKITTASVHGLCLGGGAELAMLCDFVYTARDATWGFPEIKLACFPPVACATLARLVGERRATELILTGRQFSGAEALAIGLATAALDAGELDGAVGEAIARLLTLSPSALATTKKALRECRAEFNSALDKSEEIYLREITTLEDAREGVEAFLEKRPPKWRRVRK